MTINRSVLIVGSGGREFALAQRFSEEPTVSQILVVPGNPAMQRHIRCVCIEGHVPTIAQQYGVDLVIIGPEKPLVEGLADELRALQIPVVGPSKSASILEASKIASKQFMMDMEIPTVKSEWYDSPESAIEGLENWSAEDGVVIKSDALAGGKGVVLCDSLTEAETVVMDFMVNPAVTVQTDRILLEEKLYGVEVSAFALCDGQEWISLGLACDHKRVGEEDTGQNTGGMGAFTPDEFLTPHQRLEIERIFDAVVSGMALRGTPFQGILFAGLMIHSDGVRPGSSDQVAVLEFNIRLGDPEAQVLLPTLEGRLFDACYAAANGTLRNNEFVFERSTYAVHVVAAAQGYPSIDGSPIDQGSVIRIEELPKGASVVFSGVSIQREQLTTKGGRVLGITGIANSLEEARELAYQGMDRIHFDGMHFRRDIASPNRMRVR